MNPVFASMRYVLPVTLSFMLAGCADRPPAVDRAGRSLFTDVTSSAGIDVGPPPADGSYFMPEIMGTGVGLLDYDGDGDLDILQVRAPLPGREPGPAPNRLYAQQPGFVFEDMTQRSGLGDAGFGQGVAAGDVDDDGDVDLYFTNHGADTFYLNNGDGTFRNATTDAGFGGERWSSSATFCDYDRDGDLDLYVAHYLRVDYDGSCRDHAGGPDYCGPDTFDGEPDRLYRNTGDGRFSDVTETAGIRLASAREGKGLGVVCVDLTGDGRVDFYVANDGEANQLWVNRGDGMFDDQALIRGVAFNRHGKAEASMGIAVGDLNRDGRIDLFMTHLTLENNTLFLSGAEELFEDGSVRSGAAAHDLGLTGFGCGLFDVDHDGDLDIAVANGEVRRDAAGRDGVGSGFWDDYAQPNLLLNNDGSGFLAPAAGAGQFTDPVETSRGLAFGDLDGDGDLDMVLADIGNRLRIYRNDAPAAGTHWLLVRARTGARDALGARVTLFAGEQRRVGTVLAGYSYLSSHDPRAHFGLGELDGIDAIEVLWPDGRAERFSVDGVDREVVVVQGTGEAP